MSVEVFGPIWVTGHLEMLHSLQANLVHFETEPPMHASSICPSQFIVPLPEKTFAMRSSPLASSHFVSTSAGFAAQHM